MSREAELDEAVTQLLNVDSKLGILAGLTLVAKKHQELQSEDEDAAAATTGGSPPDKPRDSTGRRATRRHSSVHSRDSVVPGRDLGTADIGGGTGGTTVKRKTTKPSVHDQRDVIRKLQEQNQILKQELAIESRDAKAMLSLGKRQQLGYLHKMAASFSRKLALEKKNAARLDKLLAKKTLELEAVRQQSETSSSKSGADASGLSSLSGASETPAVVAMEGSGASVRRVRALENRLELSLVKKNEMDSINKHLRAQIDKVRKDRVIFDGIYKKLEKELSECRQRHDLSADELQKAIDARHHVSVEVAKIHARAEHEQRAYEQQFQTLKTSIETAMREAARLSDGVALPLASVSGKSDALSDRTEAFVATGSVGTKESPLNRISALSSWKIGYDRALAATTETVTAKYERAFAGIRATSGMRDIGKIADAIVGRDDANFKRFKRVEELHAEEATVRAQIDALTLQTEAFKAEQGLATSARPNQQLRATTDTLRQALDKSRAYDHEVENATTALTRIKSSVHSIHSMLVHANCARNVDPFSQGSAHLALGSHSARDVTDANVLEYLQAIETFATSLMKETHEAASTMAADALDASSAPGRSDTLASPVGRRVPGADRVEMAAASSSSPIGHGPLTLPSDPSQRLRVHVPSAGGVNGVIVVPASSPFERNDENDTVAGDERKKGRGVQAAKKSLLHPQAQAQAHTLHLHQGLQRRKSGGRFELMVRKSQSQVQFAAALAAAVESEGDVSLSLTHQQHPKVGDGASALVVSGDGETEAASGPGGGLEEEEEERALTYDELRQFAATHVVTKKSDDASLSSGLSVAPSTSTPVRRTTTPAAE